MSDQINAALQSLLDKAREYAAQDNAAVGTRYLLLAVLADTQSHSSQYLKTAGLIIRDVKKQFAGLPKDEAKPGTLTDQVKQAVARARDEAAQLGGQEPDTDHVMLALLPGKKATVMDQTDFSMLMDKLSIQSTSFRNHLLKKLASGGEDDALFVTPMLSEYATNLVALAAKGLLDPVVGRDAEVERLMLVLGQRQQANAVLIGEQGVGKQSIINFFAQLIALGNVPEQFKNKRLEVLDINLMVAGSKYRGEFEERMKALITEVKSAANVILVIPKLEIVGVGQIGDSAADAASILSPALREGTIRVIGTATLAEYKKNVEKDATVSGLFDSILVNEPNVDAAIAMMNAVAPKFEQYHGGIKYTPEAIVAAVKQAKRYLSEKVLPGSARGVIDLAGSRAHLAGQAVVDVNNIDETLALITRIPLGKISESDADRLLRMEDYLHQRVVGQVEAVEAVADCFRRNGAGLGNLNGPMGSFLFSGTTGVGKTEIARALNDLMFPGQEMVRLDMSEFQEKHTVSRLVGSPPGYVGYGDGGELTEPVRKRPYCLVLLDEVEKAHEDVLLLMLQVLEDGRLTDSEGRTVDFKNTVVVMTTNIGADKLGAKKAGGSGINLNRSTKDGAQKLQKEDVLEEIKKYFKAEFRNRIDEIIVFHQLSEEDVKSILTILLKGLNAQLTEKGLSLELSETAISFLVKAGYQPDMGARPLKRAITDHIRNRLAKGVLSKKFSVGDVIEATVKGDEIVFNARKKSA